MKKGPKRHEGEKLISLSVKLDRIWFDWKEVLFGGFKVLIFGNPEQIP